MTQYADAVETRRFQKVLDEEMARLLEASPSIAQLPAEERRNIWLSMWRAVNRCELLRVERAR